MAAGRCQRHEQVVDGCAACTKTSDGDALPEHSAQRPERTDLAEALGVTVEALEETFTLVADLGDESGDKTSVSDLERQLALLVAVAAGEVSVPVPGIERRRLPNLSLVFWGPTCSCGWKGRAASTPQLAWQAAHQHAAGHDGTVRSRT